MPPSAVITIGSSDNLLSEIPPSTMKYIYHGGNEHFNICREGLGHREEIGIGAAGHQNGPFLDEDFDG